MSRLNNPLHLSKASPLKSSYFGRSLWRLIRSLDIRFSKNGHQKKNIQMVSPVEAHHSKQPPHSGFYPLIQCCWQQQRELPHETGFPIKPYYALHIIILTSMHLDYKQHRDFSKWGVPHQRGERANNVGDIWLWCEIIKKLFTSFVLQLRKLKLDGYVCVHGNTANSG